MISEQCLSITELFNLNDIYETSLLHLQIFRSFFLWQTKLGRAMDALYNWDLFNVLGIKAIIKKDHFHSPCLNLKYNLHPWKKIFILWYNDFLYSMKMVIFSSRKACLFSLCNVRICYYNHVIQANFPLKRINAVYEMNVFILCFITVWIIWILLLIMENTLCTSWFWWIPLATLWWSKE